MKKEVIYVESDPHGRPFYVYRLHDGEWIFWRKFKETSDAEGCLSEKSRMPCREIYVGGEFIIELAS